MALVRRQIENFLASSVGPILGFDKSIFTEFEFASGVTPFTHVNYPLFTVICYCIGIPLLERIMKGRKSPPLKYILVLHNLFLSAISAFVAIFMISVLLSFMEEKNYNLFHIYCSLTHFDQKGSLTLIYYINHLLKYYELLDTIFLVLKHKPLTFLHSYHHPATLVLTWVQLVDSTGVQWVVILLNLFVHTVMYFYYFMASVKINMPYKKIVTMLQIIQFIIDLFACYYAWISHNIFGKCFGTNRAGIVGVFILSSYLYLFVDFYQTRYASTKDKKLKKNKKNKPFIMMPDQKKNQ